MCHQEPGGGTREAKGQGLRPRAEGDGALSQPKMEWLRYPVADSASCHKEDVLQFVRSLMCCVNVRVCRGDRAGKSGGLYSGMRDTLF